MIGQQDWGRSRRVDFVKPRFYPADFGFDFDLVVLPTIYRLRVRPRLRVILGV